LIIISCAFISTGKALSRKSTPVGRCVVGV
jgi:hypothetical protein